MKKHLSHPFTGTPFRPVGYRNPRPGEVGLQPIYPIGGASEDGAGAGGDGGDGGDAGKKTTDDGDLGDAGKKAIQEEREARKAEKRRADAAERELENLRNKDKTEAEKAIDDAKKAGRAEADQVNNARLVNAELRALAAAAKMRDPRDAIAQLSADLTEVKVEDGEVDSGQLQKLLDDLKTNKPYLFDDGTSSTSHRDAGIGGTGGGNDKPVVAPGRARIKSAIDASTKK
ncbi:hypothetical protein HMPREF0063_10061 [Aeromicrobium marinum DSM 15272]|uniref:Scaffolding protein n=1 Tax=Aeromicrobium marinum DSM 15272 TaxID=585531 RepID=E2S7Q4_9ACTN|nr:hypothetical protein [Aeromicrobium marinum]EFQ84720.1 hypothetical protein HMPREF0063_10061 [Aeromicrobium marinum DSM 15272]